jgi:hypothetical protein
MFIEEHRLLEFGVDVGSPHSTILLSTLGLRKQQFGNVYSNNECSDNVARYSVRVQHNLESALCKLKPK